MTVEAPEVEDTHYTDEPWTVDVVTTIAGNGEEETLYVNHVYPDSDPKESDHTDEIARIVMDYPGRMARNNACRIVACVNNCKGINPYAIPYLLSFLRRVGGAAASPGTLPDWVAQLCEETAAKLKEPWIPGKELS